ncbi:MAG: hypothetical protein ACKVHR_16730 [Pirellulales bacterium]
MLSSSGCPSSKIHIDIRWPMRYATGVPNDYYRDPASSGDFETSQR